MKGLAGAAALGLALVSGCTVGPDYKRPAAPVPAVFKEAAGWKKAAPEDAADRGPWWHIYGEPELDRLEPQIDVSNQNLKAAEAAYRQARAVVAAAEAQFFPTLGLTGSATRSGSGPGSNSGRLAGFSRGGFAQNLFAVSADASWAPDLWGKIRRTVESNVASAQASAAEIASARLSAQSELATDYLELRIEDALKRLLDSTAAAYAQSLEITKNQFNAGIATGSDVAQAQAQLQTTEAQAVNVGVLRAQLVHAIAILIGKPPAEFSIAAAPRVPGIPVVPAGIPSALLERRPDIAAAERQMAAANAQIGVAVAAYYPNVTLSGDYGLQSTMLATLFEAKSNIWSFGTNLAETVLDFGARAAAVAEAKAAYRQNVASYRQTVLAAFQQVEDQFAALRILAEQQKVQDQAVKSAEEAARLILNEYKAGTVAYTSVIVAQAAALADEEAALTVRQNRLTASVALIQALGGGWNARDLPTPAEVKDEAKPSGKQGAAALSGNNPH
ncbi:MAG TPA: efflux transporter outer membrane subunit [Stellaceae bacterium]|nr:efflux transporter outer membrane subunit [Stellaceae bacterium]